jgi:hypothetical protein
VRGDDAWQGKDARSSATIAWGLSIGPLRGEDWSPGLPPSVSAAVSGQLESHHFFRVGDTVESIDGETGSVVDAASLFAVIRWADGQETEVDQFDPKVTVLTRAPHER